MGEDQLEIRIGSALKEASEHFPVHNDTSASPYYGVKEINTHSIGRYHIISLRYHRSIFKNEPDIDNFKKAIVKYYAKARGLDEDFPGKIFRIIKSKSQYSDKPDAVRIRIHPECQLEDGKKHVGYEPLLTASLDTEAKKMFFSYRRGDPEAKLLLTRFVLSYMDGKEQRKALPVCESRIYDTHDPDSTITNLGPVAS